VQHLTLNRYRTIAASVAVAFCTVSFPEYSLAEVDLFQQALNYVFTGDLAPQHAPEIVDRESCIVIMPDTKTGGFVRYYMARFRMEDALFNKIYSGSEVRYALDVKGNDTIIEYLSSDKRTVTQRYRSAQIPLPGDIDQTQKAFRIIFADYCKPKKSKGPF